jgi:hypothetical protein
VKSLIKNQSLVSEIKKKGQETTVVIKRNNPEAYQSVTRLSDVLTELPSGIIYKEETGMGATYLELTCPRNSIIVEPIKITASSKAHSHNALYVGGATRFHPRKFISNDEILDYLLDDSIPFKKIVVVADSLKRVVTLLDDLELLQKFDFFLLIDEFDSFQIDSSFREVMEEAVYLSFENFKGRWALLSATKIITSHPGLKIQDVAYFKYNMPSQRKINVITVDDLSVINTTYDVINNLLKTHPGEKIFIALNSVSNCYNLASALVKNKVIDQSLVKIHCSLSSKDKVAQYFSELETDTLPGVVNFFTSAYFTGFDLNERYHLVSVSWNKSTIYTLSENRLKQIAGRCRMALLSETVIHDLVGASRIKDHSENDLLAAAVDQIEAIKCLEQRFSKNRILSNITTEISTNILKSLNAKSFQFIRKSSEDLEYDVSWLNIDATLEIIRTQKQLYINDKQLSDKLSKVGHLVTTIQMKSTTEIEDHKISQIQRDKELDELVPKLRDLKYSFEIDQLFIEEKLTSFQKEIANRYRHVIEYVDTNIFLEKILEAIKGKRDLRKYNNLMTAAYIQTLPEDCLFKRNLRELFSINSRVSRQELKNKIIVLFIESDIEYSDTGMSDTAIVRLFSLFCSYTRGNNKKLGVYYDIKGYNPESIEVVTRRPSYIKEETLKVLGAYL